MIFSGTPFLDLVTVFLFVLAACIVALGIRAVVKGEVRGGRAGTVRRISRLSDPIQFWTEIGLYAVAAVFFVLLGLLFSGHAPDWFRHMITQRRHR
jgi:hypothetical protein